jgi:hypothetical protein
MCIQIDHWRNARGGILGAEYPCDIPQKISSAPLLSHLSHFFRASVPVMLLTN